MLKVRGPNVGVHTLIATGVNAEGYRVLGIQVPPPGGAAGWRSSASSGRPRQGSRWSRLTPAGLVAAISTTCPAAWRRFWNPLLHSQSDGSHPEALLAQSTLHSIYDQPTPNQLLPNMIGYSTL